MSADSLVLDAPAPPRDALVDRALAGDRLAEREVCKRLLPAVRAFAQRRLRGAAADDFAQDALMLFVEALREGRLTEPTRAASFALGICRNLARERARTRDRRRDLAERFLVNDPELDAAAWESPSSVRRDQLEDCLSQLTERARRVLRETFCEDGTDAEIATSLTLTEANVRVIRHRALAALRECIDRPISWVQR